MSLLAPFSLLLVSLVLIVLVLHLRKERSLTVPSLVLWRKLQLSNSVSRQRFVMPPMSLPLALQIAAVLAAVLALSYPLFGAQRDAEHWIVVVDGSARMQGQTSVAGERWIDAGLDAVRAKVQAAGPHAIERVSLIVAGAVPDIVLARQALDDVSWTFAEQQIAATDGDADWAAAMDAAAAVRWAGDSARLLLVSDASVPEEAARTFQVDGMIERIGVGSQPISRSIEATAMPVDADNGIWRLAGTVRTTEGAPALPLQVRFQPEGADRSADLAQVSLAQMARVEAPAGTVAAQFAADVTVPGAGILSLGENDAASGGAHHFVIGPDADALRVLYVGDPARALLRALDAVRSVDVFRLDDVPEDSASYDLVVIDDVAVTRTPETHTLWIGSAALDLGESAAPAPDVDEEPTATLADAAVVNWRTDHPLAVNVDWLQIEIEAASAVPRWDDGDLLLAAAEGPLVQARTTDHGREVQLAFDPAQSNWTSKASFPGFISNLIEWAGLPPAGRATNCIVGRPCQIDASVVAGEITLSSVTSGLDSEEKSRIASEALYSDDGRFTPLHAGVYTFTQGDRTRVLAVNPAVTPAPAVDRGSEPPAAAPSYPIAIWPVLAVLFLGLLLVEGWISGRGSDRFLTRAALSRTNPNFLQRRWIAALHLAALVFAVAALFNLPVPLRETVENVVLVASDADGSDTTLLARSSKSAAEASGDQRVALVPLAGGGGRVLDLAAQTGPADSDVPLKPAQALAIAAAMLPAGVPGRIVLEDHGAHRTGDVAEAIAALQQRGIAVDLVPSASAGPDEVLVHDVTALSPAYEGDSVAVTAVIHSTLAQSAEIAVLRDGASVEVRETELLAGFNRFETVVEDIAPGDALLEVRVSAASDSQSQNNSGGVAVRALPAGGVAVIASDAEQGAVFAGALGELGFVPVQLTPAEAPESLESWLAYDAIVLMNVAARDMSGPSMQQMQQAVYEHGRGLVIIGGDTSYGPGGYLETPLEQVSPLSSKIQRETPQVALVFVIDRSRSMQMPVGDVSRLDIAKEATVLASELLNQNSQTAMIAFDEKARMVMPLQMISGTEVITDSLRTLDAGGGTAIFPGLQQAFATLRETDASVRHVIVMTDGNSRPGDFETLVPEMRSEEITVSTVAIGDEANPELPELIAQLGGGVFYWSRDFSMLPSILSQEALMLSGAPVEQGVIQPVWVDRRAPFFAPLPETMPSIEGFVLTSLKPGATLALVAPDSNGEMVPLLAHWKFGNGSVMALATDATGGWTREWVGLESYPAFWAQTLRQFLPGNPYAGTSLSVSRRGDRIEIGLDALDGEQRPVEGLNLTVAVEGPLPAQVRLREAYAGHYVGTFLASEPGTYLVRASAPEGEASLRVHVAYPAALDTSGHERGAEVLSAATGGRTIGPDEPLFRPVEATWSFFSGWWIWLGAALALFVIELIVRYDRQMFTRWFGRWRRGLTPEVTRTTPFRERQSRAA